nr:hypothetical protein [uncultured Dyadobacter sp.]
MHLFLFAFVLYSHYASSQTIPIGHWQSHFNYLSGRQVVEAGSKVFCSSHNGLFSVNVGNGETRILSKADGLSSTGINAMEYLPESKLLLLTYRNGVIDFVFLNDDSEPEEIEPWNVLNNTAGLPADKAISRIIFRDGLAYLATGFGILVLDTKLRQVDETYRYIGPNGAQVRINDLTFTNDSLFATTSDGTLLGTSMQSNVNRQYFANWKTITAPGQVKSVRFFSGSVYASITGKGIFRYDKGNWKLAYPSGSSALRIVDADEKLTITTGSSIVVIDNLGATTSFNSPLFSAIQDVIRTDQEKFWVADQQKGLVSNAASNFQSILPVQGDTTLSPRADSSIVDLNGTHWTRLPQSLGGGILVDGKNGSQTRVLSTSIGNGSLPASKINSLAVDLDGYVWFASAKGVGYFSPEGVLGTGRVDAILPVYGQRKLFSNEECTALAVEPGNRKWIGTRNGLYLFNADGTELIRKFTAADSPLPADLITALRFNSENGLLFVETPNGMVSYRSDASAPAEKLSAIRIFPNPIRPGYSGTLGISGLTASSTVKITDISGRLVYEARSEGGTASWNLNDYTGRRAKGGIYLILTVSSDGSEKLAGKLVVIE